MPGRDTGPSGRRKPPAAGFPYPPRDHDELMADGNEQRRAEQAASDTTDAGARTAVITGCGRGIGRAVLERLIADGYLVVGVERDPALSAEITAAMPEVHMIVGDCADIETHARAAAEAARIAPLWGWVNNASGVEGGGAIHQVDAERVNRIIAVSLMGYFWGCAEAVKAFVRQRSGGSIVNVSSVHAQVGFSGAAAYDTAKGGVDALSRYLAVEYGPVGIRANVVAPGGVDTVGARLVIDRTEDPARTRREIESQNPFRRLADPAEIAAVVSFLLSADSSFVSGETITVDGGLTAACMPFPVDPALAEAYGLAEGERR